MAQVIANLNLLPTDRRLNRAGLRPVEQFQFRDATKGLPREWKVPRTGRRENLLYTRMSFTT